MSQSVTIRIIRRASGEAVEVTAIVPDEEWSALVRFAEYVDQLRGTRIGREGTQVTFRVKWSADSGLEYHVDNLPDEEDFAAFLHRLRPFVVDSEPTAFVRVCGILARRFSHPVAREALERPRDLFSGKSFQSQTKISVNEIVVNSEETLRTWLNAFEDHRDREKQAALEAIAPVMPLLRAIFVSMMLDKAKAVFEVARLVRMLTRGERADSGTCI